MFSGLPEMFFLEAQPAQPVWSMPLLMVGVMVIMYFFMLRPEIQKRKKEQQFRSGLKKDDKVVTTGGLYGRIVSMDETTILLQVDDSVKLRFEKAAIARLANPENASGDGKK